MQEELLEQLTAQLSRLSFLPACWRQDRHRLMSWGRSPLRNGRRIVQFRADARIDSHWRHHKPAQNHL